MNALMRLEISRRPWAAKRLGYIPKKKTETPLFKLEAKRRPHTYKKVFKQTKINIVTE